MLLRSTFLVMTLPIGVLYVIIDFLNISGRGVTLGASVNYVDKKGGGRMLLKCQRYYDINLSTKGEGGQNPQNSVNVVYGWPLPPWANWAEKSFWNGFLSILSENVPLQICTLVLLEFWMKIAEFFGNTFYIMDIIGLRVMGWGGGRHTGRKWVCRMRLDCEAK